MRLLHTTTLQMEEYFAGIEGPYLRKQQSEHEKSPNQGIPKYVILSHTWGAEEVSFQDITGDRTIAEKKIGFSKLRDSCRQARADGHTYIWIDACCIDKTSSTELSEAINSMYQWYKDSAICYVYLSDVLICPDVSISMGSRHHFYKEDQYHLDPLNYEYSRWFTRGWTLQELLAPSKLQFFDKNWRSIGAKEDHMDAISEITNIDLFALHGGDLRRLSIARRMSWAANRQTTRVEDLAYCLLGIFNINMPLLYGEGTNAFIRLQEEILKISDDQSLFAWREPSAPAYRDAYPDSSKIQGLLTSSPEVFANSGAVAQFYSQTPGQAVSVLTNKGLQIEFLMCQDKSYQSGLIYLAILNCQIGTWPGTLPAIRLRRLASNSEQYARVDVSQLLRVSAVPSTPFSPGFNPTEPQDQLYVYSLSKSIFLDWKVQTVFVRQEPQVPLLPSFLPVHYDPFSGREIEIKYAYPLQNWDSKTRVMQPGPDLRQGTRKVGAFWVQFKEISCILIFGVTRWELMPWCQVIPIERYLEEYNNTELRTKPAALGMSYLEYVFDNFRITTVTLPVDLETKRHEYACDALKVMSIAQLQNVCGRDMYLIFLHYMSDDLVEKITQFKLR